MSVGRRISKPVPELVGRPWNQVALELQDFLRNEQASGDSGTPSGFNDVTPEDVGNASADAGTGVGWASDDHVHELGLPANRGGLISRSASAVAELANSAVDGQVLTVDTAEATQMKWAAVAGGEDGEWLALSAMVL